MKNQKTNHIGSPRQRLLVLVDESNVGSSVRTAGRGLDWLKLRDFLAGPTTGRELIEMPLFLEPEIYINVPLEATYQAAFRGVPRRWRVVLEPPSS